LFATVYYLVVRFSQPAGYSYWAILGLDIFLVIMWLSQFAALGADTSAYRAYYSTYSSSYSISFDSLGYALMAVGTGLGAIELCVPPPPLHSLGLQLTPPPKVSFTSSP
jgi:hypothetical protein